MKRTLFSTYLFMGLFFIIIPTISLIFINFSNKEEIAFPMVICCLFIVIGVIFIICAIKLLLKKKKEKLIIENGIETNAFFVDYKLFVTVNNIQYFKMTYKYLNDCGEEIIQSPINNYTYPEIEYYMMREKFKIKYLDNKSTIIEKPFEKDVFGNKINSEYTNKEIYTACPYCQCIIKQDEGKCPSCGATINKSKNSQF